MEPSDHIYTNQTEAGLVKIEVTNTTPRKTRWFTGYEKQELYKIMESYRDVFNTSSVDYPSRKTKQEAWEEITSELNKRCGLDRTPAQVSLYYKNLKQRAKQRLERNMTVRKLILLFYAYEKSSAKLSLSYILNFTAVIFISMRN